VTLEAISLAHDLRDEGRGINLEIFSCAGGMAEGFRRAGIHFDIAVDLAADHCASYAANLGHKPVRMDASDLLRMAQLGWRVPVNLLVADPPCTPWSRAGKRKGLEDERDMLRETAELIALLQPRAYLIGNVPGLEDANNLPVVQEVIGGLARFGYCVRDFATLDAADYGVPQHRVRPFWFGHRHGPCIRWMPPTHGDPREIANTLPGVEQLLPWATCREALAHLTPKELGRWVKLRKRGCNTKQHASVPFKPARVVGTSNLSDGNVYQPHDPRVNKVPQQNDSYVDEPAHTICTTMRGSQALVLEGVQLDVDEGLSHPKNHPPSYIDEPAMAVRGGAGGGATRALALDNRTSAPKVSRMRKRDRNRTPQAYRTTDADTPAATIVSQIPRVGAGAGVQITFNERHAPAQPDAPAPTMGAKYRGQAAQVLDMSEGDLPQSQRVEALDEPARTVQAREDRQQKGMMLEWPWSRPSTTLQADPRLQPPGHNDRLWRARSKKNAVLLSERSAAILQGFPDGTCRCERAILAEARRVELVRAAAIKSLRKATLDDLKERARPARHTFIDAVKALPDVDPLTEFLAEEETEADLHAIRDVILLCIENLPRPPAPYRNPSGDPDSLECHACGERRQRWTFAGKTKKARWSQIGQAMPPPLSYVVAVSVRHQLELAKDDPPLETFVPFSPPVPRLEVASPEQTAMDIGLPGVCPQCCASLIVAGMAVGRAELCSGCATSPDRMMDGAA
jgi:site-specific DNA-cytosine methylase